MINTIPKDMDQPAKHPGGRPTKYNSEIPDKVREYIASCQDKEEQRVVSEGDKSTRYEFKLRVKLPTIEGLALFLKVTVSTIYEWRDTYSEFSEVVKELLQEQAKRLVDMGLSGDYNPMIAKVLLSKHGYHEIKEEQLTGKDGKDLQLTQAQAIAAIKSIEE